jgi:hypothetical protein
MNVSDAAGNCNTDTILVVVTSPPSDRLDSNLWLILIFFIILIAVLFCLWIIKRRKPESIAPSDNDEPVIETQPCPKCGFDIAKGAPCPFCAPEKPPAPEPPKKVEPTPPKVGLSKEEMLQRIEKAYKDGKMSEDQYLRNKEKFQ